MHAEPTSTQVLYRAGRLAGTTIRRQVFPWQVILLLAILAALSSCRPGPNLPGPAAPTTPPIPPTVTPTAAPDPESVKNEIKAFMVDYIVKNEIEPMIELINTEEPPMVDKPLDQFIIVASPVLPPASNDASGWMNALDTANAEQVWIYADGQLSTPPDLQKAIEDYYHNFIEDAPRMPSVFTWSYDEFGIVSISDDGRNAEVYLADTCGSLCGHGVLLKLEKDTASQWQIKDVQSIWGS